MTSPLLRAQAHPWYPWWLRGRGIAARLFVCAYLGAVGAWAIPIDWPIRPQVLRSIEPVLFYTGLWQGWDMFAPVPLQANFDLLAVIEHADGTKVTWPFPRMQDMGYGERYYRERYRKWAELVRQDRYSMLWNDAARFAAHENANPSNPVRLVTLVREWTMIPPPTPDTVSTLKVSGVKQRAEFFHLVVSPAEAR